MPSRVTCERGHHRHGTCRQAAIELAERRSLGICPQCGGPYRYRMEQEYFTTDGGGEFTVRHVIRLVSDTDAETKGWDPMVFVLDCIDGSTAFWPTYWTHDRSGSWHW